MSTHSKDIPGFLRPNSSNSNDTKSINRVAYIRTAGIENKDTRNICAKDNNVENTFFVRDAYIKSTFARNACPKNTCAENINTVKYLKMYLQSFQFSELELFGTRLEIEIRVA